jgi:hypothetical protein
MKGLGFRDRIRVLVPACRPAHPLPARRSIDPYVGYLTSDFNEAG